MEDNNRKKIFIILLAFVFLIVATNVANYYFFSAGGTMFGVQNEPTTIIRYEQRPVEGEREETKVIWEAIDSIRDNYYYPVEFDELIEGAVKGMIDQIGDPHVRFYDPKALDDLLTETRGTYAGIGVRIIEANDSIVVFETFPGTPAERNGLNPGDRLVEADGNELTGQGLNYAVELLRGPSDTTVDVLVQRPGADEPLEMTISRADIQVSTVSSEMLEDGLGYIQISNFDGNTGAEFAEHFIPMENSGLGKGLILDLRNNPGGLVDQVVEVGELLVPEGEIVRLVGRDNEVQRTYYSSASEKPYPIVVLINEESASASELLAGALQDRDAAVLVGKTTFGKASVQQLEHISGGNAIMMTVAKYFTPSGHDIDKHGIEPDFEVDMPEVLRYFRYFHPGRLESGDYGPDVEMLQMMLEQLGMIIEVTGYFDQQTERALSEFQANSGLSLTGHFDDKTWVMLRETLEIAARENDEQLNFAIELINKPGLQNLIGGSSN